MPTVDNRIALACALKEIAARPENREEYREILESSIEDLVEALTDDRLAMLGLWLKAKPVYSVN